MNLNFPWLSVSEFLGLRNTIPVVDVRSPGEYAAGHIPGAVNIPLFDDRQRAEVGTLYKNKGSTEALLRGLDLAGQNMSDKLREGLKAATGSKLLIYCWRGGMRSASMAWLFSAGGIKPSLLNGGYKEYRRHILNDLSRERRYIILGGLTGSGKTEILRHLKSTGLQVTDLEGIASHRGSAFGAMGQGSQPTTEHFANLLYDDLSLWSNKEYIWLEDESHNIGSVFMPDTFYERMQEAPVIALMLSVEIRLPRLVREYSAFPPEEIRAAVSRISKRLGGQRAKDAIKALESGDFTTAGRIILEYYDKAYHHDLSLRREEQVIYINSDTDDPAHNAALVVKAAERAG